MTSQPPGDGASVAPIVALRPPSGGLSRSRRVAGLLLTALGLPLLTLVLVARRSSLAVESMLLIYLLAVVVIAVVCGVVPALLAAVASFLLVNWFLTPPYYTLAVESRDAAIDLVVFVLAAVLVSVTVELGARNRGTAERTRVKSRLISRLGSAEISETSVMAVLEQVRGLFGLDTVALVDQARGDVARPVPSGRPTLTVQATDGLELRGYGPEIFAEDRRLLGVLAAMASRAWQGQQLAQQAAQAQQLAETDRVRSALLTAVSHDLRTPLAGIKAAVSSLRQEDISWTPEEASELLLTIEDSTDRLGDLISNLLAMTRVQAGAVSVQISPVALDEVVARALIGTEAKVTIDVPEDLPWVQADAGLLERVVANLVDNARRFSPNDAPVRVHAALSDAVGEPDHVPGGAVSNGTTISCVRLQVIDHGPGIPPSQWGKMFVPFQRLGDHDATASLGLGLAIAQGFTEAMHAELTPSANTRGGLTMTITLPVAP